MIKMSKIFKIQEVEYHIVRNEKTNGPMIARVDGLPVENRKEICRIFLRQHGWTDEMFGNRITNDLERKVNAILNGKTVLPSTKSSKPKTSKTLGIPTGQKVALSREVNKFIKIYKTDIRGRYLSYDHIRTAFIQMKDDPSKRDYLTLHLYSYLASWGMLRNSFIIQKDYLFLKPVVDILCDPHYNSLLAFDPFTENDDTNAKLIAELVKAIKDYFKDKKYYLEKSRTQKTIKNVSKTLITKIILGTFGCLVAYDTYVTKALKHYGMIQSPNAKSVLELIAFAKTNQQEIAALLSKLNSLYTPMKIIDMYFFEKGVAL